MAFPQVAAVTGGNNVAGLGQTLNLPAGATAGEILLVLVSVDGNPTQSWPGDWTKLYEAGTGNNDIGAAWKVSDGTETTVVLTLDGSQEVHYTSFRITSHGSAIEYSGPTTTGVSTIPDSPAHPPSWGAEDTLWITHAGWDTSSSVSAYPTNYTDGRQDQDSNGGVATARRELNASTEDPGTFTLASSEAWGAKTLAIKPAGLVVPPGSFPQVGDITGGNLASASSQILNLPDGVTTGQIVLVLVGADSGGAGQPRTVLWPAGWTELFDGPPDAIAFSTAAGAWKQIDGTEGFDGTGDTITITLSTADFASYTSYRITNHGGAVEASEIIAGFANGPDPPPLSPSWGALDTLWIAVMTAEYGEPIEGGGGASVNYPAAYTDGVGYYQFETGIWSARREWNAATEDPGWFTDFAGLQAVVTIAIKPGELGPGPLPVERRVGGLGECPTYIAQLTRRGGSPVLLELPWSGLDYGRALDEMTSGSVTVPATTDENCCRVLGEVRAWEHELVIWRDGASAPDWAGPITEPIWTRDSVTLRARDLFQWLERRELSEDYNPIQDDPVDIFEKFFLDAMYEDNSPNITLVKQGPAGFVAERVVLASEHRIAADELRELGRTGVDWTMRGRELLVRGENLDLPFIGIVNDEDIDNPEASPEASQRGLEAASLIVVKGSAGVVTQVGGVDPDMGLVTRVFTELTVRDGESVDHAAETLLSLLNPAPEVFQFNLNSRTTIRRETLVPGALIDVRVALACREFSRLLRLTSLAVSVQSSESGPTETVSLTCVPVGL